MNGVNSPNVKIRSGAPSIHQFFIHMSGPMSSKVIDWIRTHAKEQSTTDRNSETMTSCPVFWLARKLTGPWFMLF
jgi:hypothetical protein